MRQSDHQLVMAAFEGDLGAAEFEELQRRLKAEPELLALYREHALLHHSLTEEFEGRHSIGEAVPPVSRGPRWLLPVIAVAVIGAASFGAWKFTHREDSARIASGTPADKAEVLLELRADGPGITLLEDRFDSGEMSTGRRPSQGASHWRLERGSPQIRAGHLEGSGFETYFYIPKDGLSVARPVMLVTVQTMAGGDKPFHSPGWSGISLYQDGYEVCFFGDSYGPEWTWSLDVKRSLVPLMPAKNVTGPRTMTLLYDRRDGRVELHEGDRPGNSPLVHSKILPGMNFDQIRIGASEESSLALAWIRVRVLEEEARNNR
ncbi:hypothetical protein [Haloferula sp. BvORR071]|uniref:hypothetical protein n=1 Tax=Haloferula sp. BvORR071 TaxID=1396141 RepID=UPI002240FD68|nr:hypothetical protein [Haloferula sp. BvORR071]